MKKDGKTRRQTDRQKGVVRRHVTGICLGAGGLVGWGFCKTSDLAAVGAVLLARVEGKGTAVFHSKLLDGTGRLTETNQ